MKKISKRELINKLVELNDAINDSATSHARWACEAKTNANRTEHMIRSESYDFVLSLIKSLFRPLV